MKHTTGWMLDADNNRIIAPRADSDDNWIICEMGGSCTNPAILADAQHIVTACNAHEDLVAALERIGWHELSWKEARDLARAALDKVKG